jgi:predicted transposase/invertase (TIGR01784 family)
MFAEKNTYQTMDTTITRSMISFDWAMKRLLRSKANYEVLEGFLSELLRRDIIIKNISESESNPEDKSDKSNKVDILVEADNSEMVIIELQYDSEDDYFQRMLYGVSKTIVEYIDRGEPYSKIRKVYSINIVYFDLGKGDDYIYHGFTNFRGLHTHDELNLTTKQHELYGKTYPGELNPEYYIIKVKKFDDIAKDTLDEWIYYLKNNVIKDEFTAKGFTKARDLLAYDNMTDAEKKAYWRYIEDRRIRDSEVVTAFTDGVIKGKAIGVELGIEKGVEIGMEKGMEKGENERTKLKAELDANKAEVEFKNAELEVKNAELDAAHKQSEQQALQIEELKRLLANKA